MQNSDLHIYFQIKIRHLIELFWRNLEIKCLIITLGYVLIH